MWAIRVDFQLLFCGAFPPLSLQGQPTGVQGTAICYHFSCQSHFPSSSVERGKAQTCAAWLFLLETTAMSLGLSLVYYYYFLVYIFLSFEQFDFLWLFLCLFNAAVDNNNMIKFQLWLLQHSALPSLSLVPKTIWSLISLPASVPHLHDEANWCSLVAYWSLISVSLQSDASNRRNY